MKLLTNAFYWFRHLNIDVALAVVASSVMFFQVFQVKTHFSFWIVLFLSMWCIYTIDHVFDGMKETKQEFTKRYHFYFKNRKPLLSVIGVFGVFNAILILTFFDIRLIYAGIVMALLSLLYFLHIQKILRLLPIVKDIFSAILFTMGILIFPLFLNNGIITLSIIFFMLGFAMVVMTNILLYSINDRSIDKAHHNQTLIIKKGDKYTLSFLKLILISSMLILFMLEIISYSLTIKHAAMLLIFMQMMHLIVFLNRNYFMENERFFSIGNLIFVLPVLILLF